jgi:signal transduction histidine kinase
VKPEKGVVRGIVDELIANSIQAGASEISVRINETDKGLSIRVSDNGCGMSDAVCRAALRALNQSRRDEMDRYYGQLAGESMVGRGLNLVGIMIDEASIETVPGGGTVVEVFRKKR